MKNQKLDVEELVITSFGSTKIYMPPNYKELNRTIGYEKTSVNIFSKIIKPGDVFVDIGTHVGLFSILAGNKVGKKGKVYSFEPIPENVNALKKNIALNNLQNVEIINQALSSKSGKKIFNIRQDTGLSGFYEHPLGETVRKISVQTTTIDEQFKGKRVDFIKIDTEGHELQILRGAKQTLKNNPNAKLIIELNPGSLKNAGDSPEDLLQFIVGMGYEVYFIDDKKYKTYRMTNKYKQWKKDFPEYGYANLLCLPKKNHQHPLFVCHSSELGGAGLAMVEHVDSLLERGIVSHVVIPNKGAIEDLLIEKGISYSVLEYKFWIVPSQATKKYEEINKINMEAATHIVRLASDVDPTLVVNNSLVCPWGYPAARALELPLAWIIHEHGDDFIFRHKLKNIKKFIIESSDIVICCSETIKQNMQEIKNSTKIHRVYNSLDEKSINERAEETFHAIFLSKDSLKLCIVGRVSSSKGQLFAVKAMAQLKKKGLEVELALVGPFDEYYKKSIEDEISSSGLKVMFLGLQANPFPIIKQSDAVLVCSTNEGFGLVTAEAAILNRPVIGSDIGGTAELITDGQTGLLFKPGDVDDLARQIEKIYKNKQTRDDLASKAKEKISQVVNKERNGQQLAELFSEASKPKDRAMGAILINEWVDCVDANIVKRTQLINDFDEYQLKTQESLRKLELERNQLIQERNAMLNSRSWKATRSMRKTGLVLRKVKRKGIQAKKHFQN